MTDFVDDDKRWSFKKLMFFRFFFTYFLLFVSYDLITRLGSMINIPFQIHHDFFLWIGQTVFEIPHNGLVVNDNFVDTTYQYVALFCIFIISIVIVFFWTGIASKVENYRSLYYWLRVVLRFYVGFILVNYGLVKLFQLQFPEPSLFRLVDTYGNSSPMELAWSFLGYSKGYNLFMGIAEIMSLFLFFRRTLTFGLLVTFAVTINVLAVNFFYDIPLKIITSHLVLFTMFLLAHDFKNLINFFFNKKEVALTLLNKPKVLNNITAKKGVVALKSIFLVLIFVLATYKLNKRNTILNGEFSKSQFYGIYDAISFEKNGNLITSSNKWDKKWKYLIMEYRGRVQLVDDNNNVSLFSSSIDSIVGSIKLISDNYLTDTLTLSYEKHSDSKIIFKSKVNGDSIKVTCQILKERDFLLMKSEVNLINDDPFKR